MRCGYLVERAEQLGQVPARRELADEDQEGRVRAEHAAHRRGSGLARPERRAEPVRDHVDPLRRDAVPAHEVVANDGRDGDHRVGPAGAVAEVAAARLRAELFPRRPVRPFEDPVVLDHGPSRIPERERVRGHEHVERRGLAPERGHLPPEARCASRQNLQPQALVVRDVVDRRRAEEVDPLGGQLGRSRPAPEELLVGAADARARAYEPTGVDADDHRGTLVTTSDAVAAAGRSSGAEALTATVYRPASRLRPKCSVCRPTALLAVNCTTTRFPERTSTLNGGRVREDDDESRRSPGAGPQRPGRRAGAPPAPAGRPRRRGSGCWRRRRRGSRAGRTARRAPSAGRARPPSPLRRRRRSRPCPFPATVVIVPFGQTRRTRLLPSSAIRKPPSGSTARLCGLLKRRARSRARRRRRIRGRRSRPRS